VRPARSREHGPWDGGPADGDRAQASAHHGNAGRETSVDSAFRPSYAGFMSAAALQGTRELARLPLPFVARYEVLQNEVQCGESCAKGDNGPGRRSYWRIGVGGRGVMKRVVAAAFSLLIVFSATILVSAKGTTTKVMITSAGLQSPIVISDPVVLKNFNVWSGPGTSSNDVEGNEGFIIDWASGVVTERPSGLRTFELSFYVRYANRPFGEQTDQLAYIVSYAVDPATGQGYVYLPGQADEPYRLNTKAIYRGCEGNWFRATAAWQRAFKNVVHG
jgi:hypothetical protein